MNYETRLAVYLLHHAPHLIQIDWADSSHIDHVKTPSPYVVLIGPISVGVYLAIGFAL